MLSSGLFPGVCSLNANVSEHSVCSILIGVKVRSDCVISYIYMFIYICVCVYVCICVYIYIYVYLPFGKVVIS
jgi:hypothetical protein